MDSSQSVGSNSYLILSPTNSVTKKPDFIYFFHYSSEIYSVYNPTNSIWTVFLFHQKLFNPDFDPQIKYYIIFTDVNQNWIKTA